MIDKVEPVKAETRKVTLWLLYRADELCDITPWSHKAVEWADYYSHPRYRDEHRVVGGVFHPVVITPGGE